MRTDLAASVFDSDLQTVYGDGMTNELDAWNDLKDRLERAVVALKQLAGAAHSHSEAERLVAKASGGKLALGYMRNYDR